MAGSVLYDKDVLGGRSEQYVDVTEHVADRLQLQYALDKSGLSDRMRITKALRSPGESGSGAPADLFITHSIGARTGNAKSMRVWLVGRRPGQVRIGLEPIRHNTDALLIPSGLVKQLKDQKAIQNKWGAVISSPDVSGSHTPTIDVQVTQKMSVWPVGISTQLVSGKLRIIFLLIRIVVKMDNSGCNFELIKEELHFL